MFGRRRLRSTRAARPPARRWPRRARAALRRCADGAGAGGRRARHALRRAQAAGPAAGARCGWGRGRPSALRAPKSRRDARRREGEADRRPVRPGSCVASTAKPRPAAMPATLRGPVERAVPRKAGLRAQAEDASGGGAGACLPGGGLSGAEPGERTQGDGTGRRGTKGGSLSGGRGPWTGRAMARPPDPAPGARQVSRCGGLRTRSCRWGSPQRQPPRLLLRRRGSRAAAPGPGPAPRRPPAAGPG